MSHILNIEIGNSYDCRTLIIRDSSLWDSSKPINNIILEIKPPGKDCFISFNLYKNWCSKTFNCASLKNCCVDCPSEYTVIPDGIYDIKYSIDPNLKTMVEYSHLRTCELEKKFTQIVCNYFTDRCKFSLSEQREAREELMDILFDIKSAKWLVEECLKKEEGLELYNKVNKKLKDYGAKCGCSF